jgi:hypothetical protein
MNLGDKMRSMGMGETSDKVTPGIYFGKVISTEDNVDGRRIKVRIRGLDDKFDDNNLPFCHALLPKIVHVFPKKDEAVIVLIVDNEKSNYNRWYIGPIISQYQNIELDPLDNTALSTTELGTSNPKPAYSTNDLAKENFPKKEEVALLGRKNSDLIFGDNTFTLRGLKHKVDDNMVLNDINPVIIRGTSDENGENSRVSVQSDYMFLISHQERNQLSFDVKNDELEKVIDNTQAIARGEDLTRLLKLIVKVLLNHVHGYAHLPPDQDNNVISLSNFNIDDILNEFIRTN